jgi:hypothetical protein
MQTFLIAFSFSEQSARGIAPQLNLTDSNNFVLDKGIQLQPIWAQIPVPPLNFVTVASKSISINTANGGVTGQQGVRVTLAVSANGSSLSGNIPASGSDVGIQYQFIGYDAQGSLSVGNFTIPFPSS